MSRPSPSLLPKLGVLEWDRGQIEVQALGGMLGPARIRLDDGRVIEPFAVAPWSEDEYQPWEDTAPPLLKRLRGDWVCLPFGSPGRVRTDLDPRWLEGLDATLKSADPQQHGTCANALWTLDAIQSGTIGFSCALEAPFPISRIERQVSGVSGASAFDVDTRIVAREDCELAWGVHPTFRVPDAVGSLELSFGDAPIQVFTYPGVFERGVSRIALAQKCHSLEALPLADGGTGDFSALPLDFDTEELFLVSGHGGQIRLRNRAEGYSVHMTWDPLVFPSVLIWISNRGRRHQPWNGRFLGLGIEPVCSAFDIGHAHAVNPSSPLRAEGIATATRFEAGSILRTRYSLRFEAM